MGLAVRHERVEEPVGDFRGDPRAAILDFRGHFAIRQR